ncbi:hypothetical protein Back2_16510 [Nocardioides baekrokdamisoli]|uniref:Band 7 domain-containing protein n=1 Tax=Nocardioides baekrokdamisoli TaxID=1804624 RepID=A0A3G9J1L3_9ACTN|nr:SPFH domain-containing protein [Nocardioides baekrokdamisoli]BBH17364.1 hypothetical protein Back2_16510 [Nocardioides baekrokdamisoli]
MGALVFSVLFIAVGVFLWLRPINGFPGVRAAASPRKPLRFLAVIPIVVSGVILIGSTVVQVHAKEIGVVTAFGRPTGEIGAGLHLKWPWQSVTKINETIFTDTYSDNNALPVRLGDGNTASVSATIRWHVDPTAADYIYANYRSDNPAESLRDAVVDTQFKAAVNQVFSSYNPTANITALSFSPNYAEMGKAITASMIDRVKDATGEPLVVLDGVTVAGIQYSPATEQRINSIVAQAAKTEQAIQAEQTARAQAKANQLLAASLRDPAVLVSKCLDELAAGAFVPPAGFSCWPGSGSGVVIPSATK